MKRVLPVLGIIVCVAVMGALAYFPTAQELRLCRTCGSEQILTRRLVFGSVLSEEIRNSTVWNIAREKFGVAEHTHRWATRDELSAITTEASSLILRPLDDASQASVVSVANRLNQHKFELGKRFLQMWVEPPEDPPADRTPVTYLNLLVFKESLLMPNPIDEQMTLELYTPLILRKPTDEEMRKLIVWVDLQLKK
jgi:hypothetical protein